MNTLKNDRRHFLRAAPLAWLSGFCRRSSLGPAVPKVEREIACQAPVVNRPAGETLDEYLRGAIRDLPRLASELAEMERRGVMYEDPAT